MVCKNICLYPNGIANDAFDGVAASVNFRPYPFNHNALHRGVVQLSHPILLCKILKGTIFWLRDAYHKKSKICTKVRETRWGIHADAGHLHTMTGAFMA
jgi:hypothetical protein